LAWFQSTVAACAASAIWDWRTAIWAGGGQFLADFRHSFKAAGLVETMEGGVPASHVGESLRDVILQAHIVWLFLRRPTINVQHCW
jgi:hypothetical protein